MRRAVSLLLLVVLVGCGASNDPASAPSSSATSTSSVPSAPSTSSAPPAPAPSSASSTPLVPAPPPAGDLAGRTVVIDPGHNSGNATHPRVVNALVPAGRGRTKPCNTTGSETDAGYPEHAFNWDVAGRVRNLLAARGAEVILTRPDDNGVGPCVDRRAAIGNGPGVDAVVSIHADGAGPRSRGFHVAYSDPPLNAAQDAPTLALATAMRDALRGAGFPTADYIGSAGLDGRDDLAGLNLAERPAVLVECANLRNPGEAAAASTPDGRARYAAAIAAGVARFLGS